MTDFDQLISKIISFRDEREWKQFHNSKDLAIALNIETSELLELFLWKDNEDVDQQRLRDELADVLMYAFLLVEKHQFDISEIIEAKLNINREKYPVSKAKGTAKKYNELF